MEEYQREAREAVSWSTRREDGERAAAEAEVGRLRTACEERLGWAEAELAREKARLPCAA